MKKSELKTLIKECIVEISNDSSRSNKLSGLVREGLLNEGVIDLFGKTWEVSPDGRKIYTKIKGEKVDKDLGVPYVGEFIIADITNPKKTWYQTMIPRDYIPATKKEKDTYRAAMKAWNDEVDRKNEEAKKIGTPDKAFAFFKRVMDSDVRDGVKYPWAKYGKALKDAVKALSKDVQLKSEDLEDLYYNLAGGDAIRNKSVSKSRYYKQIKKEFDKFSEIWQNMA